MYLILSANIITTHISFGTVISVFCHLTLTGRSSQQLQVTGGRQCGLPSGSSVVVTIADSGVATTDILVLHLGLVFHIHGRT